LTTSVEFCHLLKEHGCDFFTGVPDTTLQAVFSRLEHDKSYTYVPAVCEPIAVGLAVGAWLGGRKPVVLMQNSGFALATNALASLVQLYEVPLLLVIGWRGYKLDSPEHFLLGKSMLDLLSALEIPWSIMEAESIPTNVRQAMTLMLEVKKPMALLVRPGVLHD